MSQGEKMMSQGEKVLASAEPMGARWPVYWILDTSSGCQRHWLAAMSKLLQLLTEGLRDDPQALELVWGSLITYSDAARQVVPLVDLCEIKFPTVEAKAVQPALVPALNVLNECLRRDVRYVRNCPSAPCERDARPVVFLLMRTLPVDWKAACRCGLDVPVTLFTCSLSVLPKSPLTDRFVQIEDTSSRTMTDFGRWMESMVSPGLWMDSERICHNSRDDELDNLAEARLVFPGWRYIKRSAAVETVGFPVRHLAGVRFGPTSAWGRRAPTCPKCGVGHDRYCMFVLGGKEVHKCTACDYKDY